jgi:hypothetical protein
LVPQQTREETAILGQPKTLTAEAIDAESPTLTYFWDLDINTDSNSDGIMDNDMDASGSAITQNFQQKGTYEIVCTIVNEAGASTQVTYLVSVRSSSDDSTGLSPMMIGIIATVLLIIIIAGIGLITWRRMSNARLESLLEEQAAAEEEKPRELSVEEQKAMYGAGSATLDQPTSMSTTSQFGQYATGMSGASDPQATISEDAAMGDSDLEALMSTPEAITASDQSSPASELLAEFSDEDADVEDDSVEFSHDELETTSEEVWSPDEAESFNEEDGLPSPPPPEPEPEVDTLLDEEDLPVPPVPESEELSSQPELEEESESPEIDSEPQSRIVQQDCSQCQQRFEVTLPEGHDIARTACPSCGAIETVRLS